jgi:hypothetical protein
MFVFLVRTRVRKGKPHTNCTRIQCHVMQDHSKVSVISDGTRHQEPNTALAILNLRLALQPGLTGSDRCSNCYTNAIAIPSNEQ